MDAPRSPLEPSRAEREHWLSVLAELAHEAVEARITGPAAGPLGAPAEAVAEELSIDVPEDPLPGGIEAIADHLRRAAAVGLVPAHSGYLAYVPGSGIFASTVADLAATSLNRFTGLTAASPALCRLEADVLGWLARECGYDDRAGGILLSGGSLANLAAIITAREERLPPGHDPRLATAYASGQVHHCVAKAFRLAGLPADGVREIGTDTAYRMDVGELRRAVEADRAAGRLPLAIVASAGTTNTGAVDDFAAIAALCAETNTWFHIDGAYGGAFVLCDEGRETLRGMELADSIALDPHKGLFVPFGTGCLLAKDRGALRRAHTAGAHYLRDFDPADDLSTLLSPTDHGPELSRSFRGLRIWMPLMLHGARAFRETLSEKLELARFAHAGLLAQIEAGAPLEIVAAPQLSTLAFRLVRRTGEPLTAWNARNVAFVDRINAPRRVYLATTYLPVEDGAAVCLRVCILGVTTHTDRIEMLLEDIAAAIYPGGPGPGEARRPRPAG